MKPAEYWRKSKQWHALLLQEGVVVQSTCIHVAPTAQAAYAPYSFLVVQLAHQKVEVMGVPGQVFEAGDAVRLVLRRVATNLATEPIPYGLKAEKI